MPTTLMGSRPLERQSRSDRSEAGNVKYGTIRGADCPIILRLERSMHHPIEKVWCALTDPREVWTDRLDLDPRPDPRLVTLQASGDRIGYRIVRVEPRTTPELTAWVRLEVTSVLRWQLTPTDYGCQLVLLAQFETYGSDVTGTRARLAQVIDRLEAHVED